MKTKQILWIVAGAAILFILYKIFKKPDLAMKISPIPLPVASTSIKPYVNATGPIVIGTGPRIDELGFRYSSPAALAGQY
jgi:hypothetical protein